MSCRGWAAVALWAFAGCGFREIPLEESCFVYVVASDSHSCGRKTDGSLWCWGNNQFGQLGTGDTAPRSAPVRVAPDSLAGEVAGIFVPAGSGDISSRTAFTCAVKRDGTLWCWGNNEYGQLGTGDTEDRLIPTPVLDLRDVHAAALGGGFACARKNDNSIWCWGANESGQLGTGDTEPREHPTQVDPVRLGSEVRRIAAGSAHACARKTDGTLWCWGANLYGQLGIGDTAPRPLPAQVDPDGLGASVDVVSAGGSHTCATKADMTLWCWGANQFGQLGLGDFAARSTPAQLDFTSVAAAVPTVSAGGLHTCAAKTDGSLWCWGDNRAGQLGTGLRDNSADPLQVDASALGSSVSVVYAGGRHTCARSEDSSVHCWGSGEYGQLGIGTAGRTSTVPAAVAGACPSGPSS